VLHPLNDHPVHQTSLAMEQPQSGDPNHYDRYFFNGYTDDGSLYFGAALGLYPNRRVIDAAFCVQIGTQQVSVHTSDVLAVTSAGVERRTAVGPVRIEIVEPMVHLRLVVDAPEQGLTAELTWRSRTDPVVEPRFLHATGFGHFDYTRFTQWGEWTGWLSVDGDRHDVAVRGSRDRSWGTRPVGDRLPAPPPSELPQFFWLWAPVNFDDVCTHFDVNEDARGVAWHESGFVVPVGGGEPWTAERVAHHVTWRPGTRWADHAVIELSRVDDAPRVITLTPVSTFTMLGIGYGHPEWGHGRFKHGPVVGGDRRDVTTIDPLAAHHIHVQHLCRAEFEGRIGVGILEILALGPHAPSGFMGLLDPA
jgi:hypothetical protein